MGHTIEAKPDDFAHWLVAVRASSQSPWELREHQAGLFTHCFAACRTAQGALTDPGLQS
jgi:hypothetical protein